jgi:DNA-binding beta-propeller fold protein YncE
MLFIRKQLLEMAGVGLALTGLAASVTQADSAEQAHSGYHLKNTIHLPGTEGWDYISIDSPARRLYVGRGKYLQVVDIDTGRLIAQLTDMPGVHGVALVPELRRGFTVNDEDNSSTMLDLDKLTALSRIGTGKVPDSYTYDQTTRRVFIMNSAGNDATAIDATTGSAVGMIPLDGQPEFAVSDGKGEVFVNSPTRTRCWPSMPER